MSTDNFDSYGKDNFTQYGNNPVPNSTGALVLGILSMIFCGLIGMILGIIAIVLASQGEKAFQANPQNFTEASYKNLKAGKTCGIIGICIQAAVILFVVIYFIVVGSLVFSAFR
jgi:uncharacterized membrane protein YjgN (DUF898 family)